MIGDAIAELSMLDGIVWLRLISIFSKQNNCVCVCVWVCVCVKPRVFTESYMTYYTIL